MYIRKQIITGTIEKSKQNTRIWGCLRSVYSRCRKENHLVIDINSKKRRVNEETDRGNKKDDSQRGSPFRWWSKL